MAKFSFQNRSKLKILSDDQVEKIHVSALDILETIGIRFSHEGALKILETKGCMVDHDSKIVRFPRNLVEQAIRDTPESFDMFNALGEKTMAFGKGNTYFDPGPGAPQISSVDGAKREGKIWDLKEAMRITQESKYLNMISLTVNPAECPPALLEMYFLYKALIESSKTISAAAWSTETMDDICQMLEVVRGSIEAFKEKPFIMLGFAPSPPMKWDFTVIENAMRSADYGIPFGIGSAPVMGVSAPITYAGGVLVNTVENLSFLTLIQALHPGTAVLYGGICTSLDMRTMYGSTSAAEASLCTAGYACMANYYAIPSFSNLSQTDSKAVDYQAGFETCMGAMISALSGVDLIEGAGTLDSYLSFNNEKLAIDGQLLEYVHTLAEGIRVDEETLAVDDIMKVGCGEGGTHLTTPHTLKWYRKQQCTPGKIVDRELYDTWENKGLDIIERARAHIEKVNDLDSPADTTMIKRVTEKFKQIIMEKGFDFEDRD